MRALLPLTALGVGLFLQLGNVLRSTDARAGTAIRLDLEALVERADLLVEAEVLAASSFVGPDGLIETEFVLQVARTFVGEDRTLRAVRLPGGVLPDGRGLLLPGMPRIEAGERVVLFLTAANASGMRMPVGLAQGKFDVVETPAGALRVERVTPGLSLIDPSGGTPAEGGAATELSYADFVARVEAAVALRRAREASSGGER